MNASSARRKGGATVGAEGGYHPMGWATSPRICQIIVRPKRQGLHRDFLRRPYLRGLRRPGITEFASLPFTSVQPLTGGEDHVRPWTCVAYRGWGSIRMYG